MSNQPNQPNQPRFIYTLKTSNQEGQLYVITPKGETLVVNSSTRPDFDKIITLWKELKANLSDPTTGTTGTADYWEPLYDAMAPLKAVTKAFTNVHEDVKFVSDKLYYKGTPVYSSLASNIIEKYQAGADVTGLVNFLIKLESNPSMTSRQSLYNFLEQGKFPITDDGNVLGYKSVRLDYLSHTASYVTGKHVDNSIGTEIPRLEWRDVDDDHRSVCSYGYHIGTWDYATSFNYSETTARLLISEFSPADVVSVPYEGSGSKVRVTYYKNIGETTLSKGPLPAPMYKSNVDPTTTEPNKPTEPDDEVNISDVLHKYNLEDAIGKYVLEFTKSLLNDLGINSVILEEILSKNDENPERFFIIIEDLYNDFDGPQDAYAYLLSLSDDDYVPLVDIIKRGKLKRALRILKEH